MKTNRKGQAAMEFLMTYGWAILVVLIVISALAYFGVLDPSNFVPDRCTFPVSLTCTDFVVKGNGAGFTQLQLTVANGAGQDMTVTQIEITGPAISSAQRCLVGVPASLATTIQAANSASFTVNVNTPPAGGVPPNDEKACVFVSTGKKKDIYNVNVTYNFVGSAFAKTVQGQIVSRREA